jgi:hypothetical protein
MEKDISTIRNPEFFDHSLPAGFDGIFSWNFLMEHHCFGYGNKIEPMDIDAVVERNDRIIMFETKGSLVDGEGNIVPIPIPTGQQLTLASFFKLGCVTQIILRMDVDKKYITSFQYRFPNDNTFTKFTMKNYSSIEMQKEIAKVVKMWYKDANELGKLSIKQPTNLNLVSEKVEIKPTFIDKVLLIFKLKRI